MAILELEDIAYQTNRRQILQNTSLGIEERAFLTLIGPSGAGESTILRLIVNLINPNHGQILFDDKDIMKIDPLIHRRNVSYCFQQPSLFGEKVSDNLSFPYEVRNLKVDQKRVYQLLRDANSGAEYLNKDINSLSGGEKQRVVLIRNLLFLPEVLLLDEVITGLDQASKETVRHLIGQAHRKDVTIIQVTCDQSEIEPVQHIVWIEKGGVLK